MDIKNLKFSAEEIDSLLNKIKNLGFELKEENFVFSYTFRSALTQCTFDSRIDVTYSETPCKSS